MPIVFADQFSPSWDLVADIQILLHFHFMQNAYLAGTLVAVVAGIMGYFMVLRSQSFAGHSLANVGFAGATGAVLFGIPSVIGLFVAGVCAAAGMQALNLAERHHRQSDIAVGAVFTASLALGYLFLHLAFADSVGAAATVINLPEDAKGTTTIESKTNFIGGAREGTTLIATATPVHRGRRTQVWQTRLETEDGKLVAVVTQTQMVLV